MYEKERKRLLLLIIYRVVVISLLLAIAIYMDIKKQDFTVSQSAIYFFYGVIGVTYIISIAYAFLLKLVKDIRFNVYLQLYVDIVLITILVYFSGSVQSNYSLLYTLIIIYSVIFIGRKVGLIVASACAIAYGLLLDLEYYNIIPPFLFDSQAAYHVSEGDLFLRIFLHIISFYTIAFLASFAVEQERKTRHLLEEKETEFAQLDLLFRSIIESVDTGVMTIDMQNRIKTFNRAAQEITGFELREIENKPIEEIFPQFRDFFSQQNKPAQIKSRVEAMIRTPKGREIHLGCAISILKDKNEKQIGKILVFQDITEIKLMEENLEKSKRLALIGEMAAGLAHEMRNPLASITGSIELLRQGLKLDETDRRLMQIILRGKNQLDRFVSDFLLLARPIPVSPESVDIENVIDEVIESIRVSMNFPENININKKYSKKAKTFAGRQQVRQIANNLIINALQAMPQGGTLKIEASMEKMEDGREYVVIKIGDTGCGIETNNLARVFEPFYTNKDKGTGLGLTIVGRIVDGYGGKVRIDSSVNVGTNCIVWLPVNIEKVLPVNT
ncbi:MAG TPA: PAS domain S-box protein [Deltaproteobacteria bacterium]|nr:PAS domain S-box protein [Deltaproteobacteria bacterium]